MLLRSDPAPADRRPCRVLAPRARRCYVPGGAFPCSLPRARGRSRPRRVRRTGDPSLARAWKTARDRGGPGPSDGAAPSRGTTTSSGATQRLARPRRLHQRGRRHALARHLDRALPTLVNKAVRRAARGRGEGPPTKAVRCEPEPAIEPLGHPLTLELARRTIGLVAVDLTDSDSADLVAQALKQLAGACAPWTEIPSRADNAHEEFHTCPAPPGPCSCWAASPGTSAPGRWQFSLAVLGPG
jgi:hypothetical protein